MQDFKWKRIVLKVGSALIAPNNKGCSSHFLLGIAQFIVRCRAKGIEVVLVSSGSVSAGRHLFPDQEEETIPMKKAMAAAGQTEMMSTWDKLFDFPSSQILLTHGDLRDRERYVSIRETIFTLLEFGMLPIINENDTVTTDNLKVGDNDNLSAMVAAAAEADALIICSDVDGLYDSNPHTSENAKLISWVKEIDQSIYDMAGGTTSATGTGGMRTKIEAAEKAVSHGIDTFIVNGFTELTFNMLLDGKNPGTHFQPYAKPMRDSEHWMKHTSKEQGEVIVEDNVELTSADQGSMIHSAEIVAVHGEFAVGETILVKKRDGTPIAKATSNYSSCLLNFVAEQNDEAFTKEFQRKTGPIISQQNIALLEKE